MQFSKDLTETEYKVHLVKIDKYSVNKEYLRSAPLYKSEYISYGTFDAAGYDWEVRYYPFHPDLSKEWIAIRLGLRSKVCRNGLKATLRCQLVDVTGVLPPFGDQRATYRYTKQEELGPPILLLTHEDLLKLGYLKNDSLAVECAISVWRSPRGAGANVHPSAGLPSTDLHQQLGELLQSHKGADITLFVSGESFMAHKIILAARSPIFMAEFFGSPMKESRSGVVDINGIEPAAFKAMLHFIYTDTCPELAQHHGSDIGRQESMAIAQHLLSAADRFGLDRLKLMCEDKLCSDINVGMVATNLALAEQHSCCRLKTSCIKFIVDSPANLEAVLATEGYKHLVANCPFPMTELLRSAVEKR